MFLRRTSTTTLFLAALISAYAGAQSSPQTPTPAPNAAAVNNQLTAQFEDAIKKQCKDNPLETDPKKVLKVNQCEQKAVHAYMQKARTANALSIAAKTTTVPAIQTHAPGPFMRAEALATEPGGSTGSNAVDKTGTNINPDTMMAGGSLSNTPSTCLKGNGSGINTPLIRVHRVIMTPQVASDDFGSRLGHRFIVYQVSVENNSMQYQYMLEDVSIDFSEFYGLKPGTFRFNASGQDLTLLRGVPEKGQDLDRRNALLHVLQGIGSVAGGVSGLTAFSDVMGSAVAVFNGPFIQGYTTLAPDHTSTQLNRLSDSAFLTNTIIDKQRARTIALFVPEDEIFSKYQQKLYWKDPNEFMGFDDLQTGILNGADICVDGTFIQAVATVAPTLTKAELDNSPTPTAGQSAVLTLTGTGMIQGDTEVLIGTGATQTHAMIVTSDGNAGKAQVLLPSNYTADTTAVLQSKSNTALTSATTKLTIAPQ